MSYHETSASIDTLTSPEPVDQPTRETEWLRSHEIADQHGVSGQAVARIAAAYTDGDTAKLPILRRDAPRSARRDTSYVYRTDTDARWSGEAVATLCRRLGWTSRDLAREAGIKERILDSLGGRWVGKRHHAALDAVYEEYHDQITRWWAVCHHTCGRHVVQRVTHDPDEAERVWRSEQGVCPVSVLSGTDDPPETGEGVREGRVGEALELVKTTKGKEVA